MKKYWVGFVLLFAAVLHISCTSAAGPAFAGGRSFSDSAGRSVEVSETVDSLAPSGPLAQIVLYTLAPDKLAGIATDFSREAREYIDEKYWNLPKFGQFYGKNATLNMEALISAAPQVVVDIGEVKKAIREDMDALQQQLGIPVVFVKATLDTLPETYSLLGELTGDTTRAEALSAYSGKVLEHAASVRAALPEDERVRVYAAMGKAGLNTNAKGSFHAEVLEKVGVLNVADVRPDSKGGGSAVSFEQILLWNPRIILAETEDVRKHILDDPVWESIDAVKNGRVYRIPSAPYSFISNPPSVNRLLGIMWLGHLTYPDYYSRELKKDVKEFYSLFYSIDLTDAQYEKIMKNSY